MYISLMTKRVHHLAREVMQMKNRRRLLGFHIGKTENKDLRKKVYEMSPAKLEVNSYDKILE